MAAATVQRKRKSATQDGDQRRKQARSSHNPDVDNDDDNDDNERYSTIPCSLKRIAPTEFLHRVLNHSNLLEYLGRLREVTSLVLLVATCNADDFNHVYAGTFRRACSVVIGTEQWSSKEGSADLVHALRAARNTVVECLIGCPPIQPQTNIQSLMYDLLGPTPTCIIPGKAESVEISKKFISDLLNSFATEWQTAARNHLTRHCNKFVRKWLTAELRDVVLRENPALSDNHRRLREAIACRRRDLPDDHELAKTLADWTKQLTDAFDAVQQPRPKVRVTTHMYTHTCTHTHTQA